MLIAFSGQSGRQCCLNQSTRETLKTRAAVAFEAGKPLEVVDVELEGPAAGEVLVELKATGVCHTARQIVGVDLNPAKVPLAQKFGMTDFVNAAEVENVVKAVINLTHGGADYTFECIGNVNVMRQALESCHKGWGESYVIGVVGAGQEIATRPFQLVTGRSWHGVAFGGARGRTDVPTIVDWYMEGKINIDDLITHTMPLDEINTAFDLMHAGKSIRSVILY